MTDRSCTCHPDDNPPVPCPQKFALSECRAAAMTEWKLVPVEPTTEMIGAVTWRSSGWVRGSEYAADTYRAMLAAVPEGKP